jgi:hypothetical protein
MLLLPQRRSFDTFIIPKSEIAFRHNASDPESDDERVESGGNLSREKSSYHVAASSPYWRSANGSKKVCVGSLSIV